MLFINLMRIARNPQNTSIVFSISKNLRKIGLLQSQLKNVLDNSENNEFIRSKKMLPPFELAQLQKLNVGTLGRTYADHMIGLGLRPDFFDSVPLNDETAYTIMRMRETHDIWHIVTGFGTSVPEELGLQAFMFAQVPTPLAPLLIAGRILQSTLKNPKEVNQIFDNVSLGWQSGKLARSMFAIEWEKNWDKPLIEVRQYCLIPDEGVKFSRINTVHNSSSYFT